MTKHHCAIAALVAAAAALPAAAQTLKPGLWEITNKMQSGSGQMENAMSQMQQQMASMPPEQRKMIEEQMARSGVKMGSAGPAGGMSVRICMTKEMVEKNEMPAQQGDCKTTAQSRTGNTMKMAFACTNPPSSGDGQITFNGSESYSSKMNVTTTMQGRPEKMTMEGSGKWLAADCGEIKPFRQPLPKK
ncbi:DUF3617 domain-containing protein [Caenimonas terrae]|uniref:DUF3617 domain-containing protein n=1 Tax=Caenimonas terrae TaxID=696074 RepID=A0ABW0N957_9BURK